MQQALAGTRSATYKQIEPIGNKPMSFDEEAHKPAVVPPSPGHFCCWNRIAGECDLAKGSSTVNIAPEHVCRESRVLFLKWFVPSVCTFFRSTKASIVKCNDDDHSMGANNGHSDIFCPIMLMHWPWQNFDTHSYLVANAVNTPAEAKDLACWIPIIVSNNRIILAEVVAEQR